MINYRGHQSKSSHRAGGKPWGEKLDVGPFYPPQIIHALGIYQIHISYVSAAVI